MLDHVTITGKPGDYAIRFDYLEDPPSFSHSASGLMPEQMVSLYERLEPMSLVRYAGETPQT